MFRCSLSILLRTVVVASLCVLAASGCSPQEPLDDGSAATGSSQAASPATESSQQPAVNPSLDETVTYVVPEGWSPSEVSGLQRFTFQIKEDALNVETTAMGLPGSATNLLPNVNLWRRRVGLEKTTQDDLEADLESIEVDGRPGHFVTLVGPADVERPLAIVVVLVGDQDPTWLFKMVGDAKLVLREKERFEAFVKSVKFAPAADQTLDLDTSESGSE